MVKNGLKMRAQIVRGHAGPVVGDLDADAAVVTRLDAHGRGCRRRGRSSSPAPRSAPGAGRPPGAGSRRPRCPAPSSNSVRTSTCWASRRPRCSVRTCRSSSATWQRDGCRGKCSANSTRSRTMLAARFVAPSMTLRPFRTSSLSRLWSRRCTWPRMIMSGLLISWATPPASSPTAASRSARTTSVCDRRRSSSCTARLRVQARIVEREPDLVGARTRAARPPRRENGRRSWRPSESVPRMRWRARIGTQTKPGCRRRSPRRARCEEVVRARRPRPALAPGR